MSAGCSDVLQALVERGHSLVVIEHNLDVLKSADWILEIGPEAGEAGGRIVAEGTPEAIARAGVATSPFMRAALAEDAEAIHVRNHGAAEPEGSGGAGRPASSSIEVVGARENNLKNLSVSIPLRSSRSSPASRAPESRPWHSTSSSPRASAGSWSRCRPMRASSSSRCRARRSTG
jgi:hypothetical protein